MSAPLPRAYPFDGPRLGHPLTPPDTEDYSGTLHPSSSVPMGLGIELDPALSHVSSATETPLNPRKSSVPYINSGLRESRERTVHRGLKWLVVVIPPSSFAHDHGHLGHTLSSGPAHRLSQGILMPLYPSMGGQLTAIAREFSFPSTAGLCIYLHTVQAGIAVAPRISEDIWPLLWSHLFDPRSPPPAPSQIPIGGRIEFDIDLGRARWYESWLSVPRRDMLDVPMNVAASRPTTLSHFRLDSRTTFAVEDQGDEPQLETISLMRQGRPRLNKHTPRKLSLVDRLESASVRSGSKLNPNSRQNSPPSAAAGPGGPANALSPIVQEDSPVSDRKHLDQFVTTWRAGASKAARSPLAATGQTSLDPANLPNTIPLGESTPTATSPTSDIDLADYAWSVSSLGPPDYDDSESVESWDRLPSVHLDRRLEGSVLLTPTTVTSLALWDVDWEYSPISNVERLPSPDIAVRMIEDCPPTPSTATSWGPPSEYPPSPSSERSYYYRAPSIDLGERMLHSRPVTPSTATSWGPPLSWPPSPAPPYHVRTPDAGERTLDVEFSGDGPWHHVWPYNPSSEEAATPWEQVWPYNTNRTPHAEPWSQVWPYNADRTHTASRMPVCLSNTYRTAENEMTTSGYPHFNLYPPVTGTNYGFVEEISIRLEHRYPSIVIYPAVYPHFDIYEGSAPQQDKIDGRSIPIKLSPQYPTFDIYPAVYPWSLTSIYPPVRSDNAGASISLRLPAAAYPSLSIYSSVYPYNLDEVYPTRSIESHPASPLQEPEAIKLQVQSQYPTFELYPPVYSHSLARVESPTSVVKDNLPSREVLTALPAVYPSFEIYPAVYPWNLETVYPVKIHAVLSNSVRGTSVKLPVHYPSFDIYPAVYPASLDCIYPVIPVRKVSERGIQISLPNAYPALTIYPKVYPYNLESIYPDVDQVKPSGAKSLRFLSRLPVPRRPSVHLNVAGLSSPYMKKERVRDLPTHVRASSGSSRLSDVPPVPPLPANLQRFNGKSPLSALRIATPKAPIVLVHLSPAYPAIQPYPPVYPYLTIYPELVTSLALRNPVPPASYGSYPHLIIYPAVYPHLEVYPPRAGAQAIVTAVQHIVDVFQGPYPQLVIYPAVYPHFEIYPPIAGIQGVEFTEQHSKSSYPYLVIYPVVYPHLEIYPSIAGVQSVVPAIQHSQNGMTKTSGSRRQPKYSHLDLHNQVFDKSGPPSRQAQRRKPKYTHAELHLQVFGEPKSPESPRRALPSPPTHTVAQPDEVSPSQPVVSRIRRRSGTVTNRTPLPHPTLESRRLPTIPIGSSTSTSPQLSTPRSYGLPPSPAFKRLSKLSSSLPSVSEPDASLSAKALSPVSARSTATTSASSASPESTESSRSFRHSVYGPTIRPVPQPGANLTRSKSSISSFASRNGLRTLPPRPQLRRQDILPAKAQNLEAGTNDAFDSPPLQATLAQFPAPPRPPLPSVPSVKPAAYTNRL